MAPSLLVPVPVVPSSASKSRTAVRGMHIQPATRQAGALDTVYRTAASVFSTVASTKRRSATLVEQLALLPVQDPFEKEALNERKSTALLSKPTKRDSVSVKAACGKFRGPTTKPRGNIATSTPRLVCRSKLGNVGWHTFRHTHRAWLDNTGAPIGVQQKLMRHADITTTGKYGDALMESKRKHNSLVARRALGNQQSDGNHGSRQPAA